MNRNQGNVDPLDLSPDRALLREVLGQYPDSPIMRAALRRLAAFFAALGKGPTEATVEEIEAFRREGLRYLAQGTRDIYWTFSRRFYKAAFQAGSVSLEVAVATGVDPLDVSPDRALLREVLGQYPDDRRVPTALRRLAGFFARLGKGPTEATVEELDAFRRHLRDDFANVVYTSEVYFYARAVRRFYARAFETVRVTMPVAAAGGCGVEISPDRDALRAFISEHRSGWHCETAMDLLARFFARRGKGPVGAPQRERAALYHELRSAPRGMQTAYRNWIERFYAATE